MQLVCTRFSVYICVQSTYNLLTNMASFKAKIRGRRSNGLHTVYILCSHNRSISYIKTDIIVSDKGLDKHTGEIKDKMVLLRTSALISSYYDKLRGHKVDRLKAKELVAIINGDEAQGISFTEFSKAHIRRITERGVKCPEQYGLALKSYMRYMKSSDILFSDITTRNLRDWIDSIRHTKRAKNMYPTLLKTMFNAGLEEYNDYDRNVIRISNRPFEFLHVPRRDTPEKRSVSPDVLRAFFAYQAKSERSRYAQDVLMLSFCLAGMNVADLYELTPDNYREGKICYQRQKTMGRRADSAYIEVTLPDIAREAFERLKVGRHEGKLLNLSTQHAVRVKCTSLVSVAAQRICAAAGLPALTSYSFRHSWATIARNDVGASVDDVALALNHASAHHVTDKYIRKDFRRVDELNAEVLALVFGLHPNDEPSE